MSLPRSCSREGECGSFVEELAIDNQGLQVMVSVGVITTMTSINDLADSAVVQIYPISPSLSAADAEELVSGLTKLFVQFERENNVAAAVINCVEEGSALVMAYEQGQSNLSGCRKDKVAKFLSQFEEKQHVQILNAPPMLVEVAGSWQAHARSGLKPLVESGAVTLETQAYDLRCQTVGEWRDGAKKQIKDMWMRPIIERLQAAN